MRQIDFSFRFPPSMVGLVMFSSILQAGIIHAQPLKSLTSIPSSWPNWVMKSSRVRTVSGQGLFYCVDATVPQNVQASNADPEISAEARKAAKCPKNSVIMRAIQPLRDPHQMPFVCTIIPNPEEMVEEKPGEAFDTTTGKTIYTPPEKPLCPKGANVNWITPDLTGQTLPKGHPPGPGTRPNY